MTRKSHITAFSLPKETEVILSTYQNKYHKTRSELLREMINFYVDSESARIKGKDQLIIDDHDANKILTLYYSLLSQSKPKPTIIVGIGIVNKKNQVIIGLRKDKNKFVKDLHWTFPSGRMDSLDFEKGVLREVKEETGFNTKIVSIIHSRLIPDTPDKPVRIIALYYHCKVLGGKQRPGGDFKELKWVPAGEVHRHFTTSVSDEVTLFLGTLH